MIRLHEANSDWWGRPVGIVTSPEFFRADAAARTAALQPYDWAEFKTPLNDAPSSLELCACGFALADIQINFRIALPAVADTPSLARYQCVAAQPFAESPNVRAFGYERFRLLPGVTTELLDARYAAWANALITAHPEWCLQLMLNGRTQGWFLAQPDGGALRLTLGMLSADAVASGAHLYQAALREFATRGAKIGHAAFSASNTPVLNIYARLGAVFTPPTGVWLWVSPRAASGPLRRPA
ncbi:MAG TPA: hypothetical protein VEC39_14190 [Vicinamibacterales bacterium]|nr:hypothetical protein [Vicinamibacterales bacterium]